MNFLQKDKREGDFTAIDLFSGCGGLTTGLKMAEFKVIAAIELDEKARQTFTLNHPDVWLAGKDIRDTDPCKLMNDLGLKPGELDLLAGCPPCQGFSRIRKRNKNNAISDDRNKLIDNFANFVLVMQPKLIMLENVPGLADYHRFKEFVDVLKRIGYQVCYEILNVADYGVPQRRKRLIVSASKIGQPRLAAPNNNKVTVREAIEGLPPVGSSNDLLHDLPQIRSEHIQALIKAIPKNGGSRSALPDKFILNCHRKMKGFNDVYGRMKWDDIAPTITGGCCNPSKGRFLHPDHDRAITLREASLLQGFPSNYKFDIAHGKESLAVMIGNALPPPFITAHAKAMKISLSMGV